MKNTSYPIKERNSMIIEFFNFHGFNNIILIGDENQPKIIMDDMKAICGFVKNKIYNFTNKQFGGEIIYSIDLNNKEKENQTHLLTIINSADRKKVFRLQSTESKMYYVKTEKLIPYFSTIESRYFFNIEKAISIQNFLIKQHQIDTKLV